MDRLLDVTRIRFGALDLYFENFELNALIRDVVGRLSIPELRDSTSLQVISLRLDSPIEGNWDRLRIDQVVTNLVSNAIKFGEKRPIVVSAVAEPDHAVIRVQDQGIGIDPENLDRIFERCERGNARSYHEGLGLGLWITRCIVEAHGGVISVDSKRGQGSTFTVRLPLRRQRDSSNGFARRS